MGLRRVAARAGAERMTSNHFKAWRKALGLSQKKAADALGLKNRIVQYYEKGERDGEKVKIPKHVRLACYALSLGVADYHGPEARCAGRRAQAAEPQEARGRGRGGSGGAITALAALDIDAAAHNISRMSGKDITAGPAADVAEFVERLRRLPSETRAAGAGRLVFALDATASRQATWDLATHVQSEMFLEAGRVGGLAVQLVFYRGFGECKSSAWVRDAAELVRLMRTVRCVAGKTQIAARAPSRGAGSAQEAGPGAGVRRRLHGGGRRRVGPARGRARPPGGARVHVPRGSRRPARSRPSSRSPTSPAAPAFPSPAHPPPI